MSRRGLVVWFQGLPNAGKTTISRLVAEKLRTRGMAVERLDSDEVPRSLTKDLSSDWMTRQRQKCSNLIYVASVLARHDVVVLLASVGRLQEMREHARRVIPDYVEVYLTCPLETRLRRDALDKYVRHAQTIHYYEPPVAPELTIETDLWDREGCADQVIAYMEEYWRVRM